MTVKKFINNFDFDNPDWNNLPLNFPNCDLGGLTSEEVGKFNSILVLFEINRPSKNNFQSRAWQDPKGYQYLALWQNASLLRILVRKFTLTLPLSEQRRKIQMDDAARSVKRNIEEGWKRSTTIEYLKFLSYSQGSLEEVKGDIRDLKQDGFLKSIPGSSLFSKGINLRVVKGLKVKGEPDEPGHPYAKALANLKGEDLTFEMFQELINKTDYLLRKLVKSLERKLSREEKNYLVQQAHIERKIKGW